MNNRIVGAAVLAGGALAYFAYNLFANENTTQEIKSTTTTKSTANATTSESTSPSLSPEEIQQIKAQEAGIIAKANELLLEDQIEAALDLLNRYKQVTKQTNFQMQRLLLLYEEDEKKAQLLTKELTKTATTEAQRQLAAIYELLYHDDKAQRERGCQLLEEQVDKFPMDPLFLLERSLWGNQDTATVRSDCDRIVAIHAKNGSKVVPRYMLARVYYNKAATYETTRTPEDRQEKLRLLTLSLEQYPRFVQALLDRYLLYSELKRYEESLADIKLAAEIDKQNPSVLTKLGFFHLRRGNVDQARATFQVILTDIAKQVTSRLKQVTSIADLTSDLHMKYKFVVSAGMTMARIYSIYDHDLENVVKVLDKTKSTVKLFNTRVAPKGRPEVFTEPFDIWVLQIAYYFAHLEFAEGVQRANKFYQQVVEATKALNEKVQQLRRGAGSTASTGAAVAGFPEINTDDVEKLKTWLTIFKRSKDYGENVQGFIEKYPAVKSLYLEHKTRQKPLTMTEMGKVLESIQIDLTPQEIQMNLAGRPGETPEEAMKRQVETVKQQQLRAIWAMHMDGICHMVCWKTETQTQMVKEATMFKHTLISPPYKIFYDLSHNGYLAMIFFMTASQPQELQRLSRLLLAFDAQAKKLGKDIFQEAITYFKEAGQYLQGSAANATASANGDFTSAADVTPSPEIASNENEQL